MNDAVDENNWLHAEMITCPNCRQELYRLDHSPMLDDYTLYCDHCANSVEVGFYDPVYSAIFNDLSARGQEVKYRDLMLAIEQKLKPCSCGGHYGYDTPRRCYNCLIIIIQHAAGVDLYPAIYALNVEERDPSAEEIAIVNEYEATHIRREGIWQ